MSGAAARRRSLLYRYHRASGAGAGVAADDFLDRHYC